MRCSAVIKTSSMIIRRKRCPHVVPPVIFDSNVMSELLRSYDGNDENERINHQVRVPSSSLRTKSLSEVDGFENKLMSSTTRQTAAALAVGQRNRSVLIFSKGEVVQGTPKL
eukprot:scaffold3189_cov141-Skeletonema_menzelii.AAC.6